MTAAVGAVEPRVPPVVLVGFMGAGKSAVGRALAVALGISFTDTDELVTATAGPISDLFARRGEAGFRAVEGEVTLAAIDEARRAPQVLALGGGALLSEDVRQALRALPHVVWLTAPLHVLWKRVRAGGEPERPLAGDEAAFRRLFAAREALYREVATLTADNDGSGAPEDVAERLLAVLAGDPVAAHPADASKARGT